MKNRKTLSIIAAICLFALMIPLFCGCSAKTDNENVIKSEATIEGEIISVRNGELLVSSDSGLYFVSTDEKTAVSKKGRELEKSELCPGMAVQIGYNGMVQETYPGMVYAEQINVTAEEGSKINLYAEALKHIIEENERPQMKTVKTIALDFTELTDLSDRQKDALEYLLTNYFMQKSDAELIRSSYQELLKDGRLTKDGEFEDGVIFSIGNNKGQKSFFVSQNWAALNADGCRDCTAKFRDGDWEIKYDGLWVS